MSKEYKKLQDLCISITDCPHSTPQWTKDGFLVIRNYNIKSGRLDLSKPSYTNKMDFAKRIQRAAPKAGDIIITREAPMGEVCRIPDGLECCLGQRIVLLKPNYSLVDGDYLLYALMSKEVQTQILYNEGTGSTVSNLRIPLLCNLPIPYVDRTQQRKISGILANIDHKIALNTAINDNLRQQAQAIYNNMFITCASPTWEKGHLSDFVTVKYGKDHKKLANGKIPVYGSGGIMRYAERPIYTRESVLIPRKGTLNNVIYVSEPFWSVDTMFYTEMLRPNVAKFIYHFISGKDLASLNAGSAVPSMTTDILNKMELSIPDDDSLSIFEETVAPMYKSMDGNRKQSKKLAEMRDALLPRLMSGELNVSGIDI